MGDGGGLCEMLGCECGCFPAAGLLRTGDTVEPDLPSTQFRTSSGAVVPGRVANTAWRTWDLLVERCQVY